MFTVQGNRIPSVRSQRNDRTKMESATTFRSNGKWPSGRIPLAIFVNRLFRSVARYNVLKAVESPLTRFVI